MSEESNAAERRRWNDEYWASVWPKREQLTSAVTEILLSHADLTPGQNVFEIGSGGGTATMAAGRLLGPTGRVVAADISTPLVDFARRRAGEAGLHNISFVVADAQHDVIEGGPFDAVISQFGVMFFDEPEAAFANIRAQVSRGGRLAFACWQQVDRNPWFVGPALVGLVPPPPAPAPGKSVTGPFSFSDPQRVLTILGASGWKAVERAPYERTVNVDRAAIVDDGQLAFLGVSEESLPAARQAVDAHLARLRSGDGRIDAPLAFQIFTATA